MWDGESTKEGVWTNQTLNGGCSARNELTSHGSWKIEQFQVCLSLFADGGISRSILSLTFEQRAIWQSVYVMEIYNQPLLQLKLQIGWESRTRDIRQKCHMYFELFIWPTSVFPDNIFLLGLPNGLRTSYYCVLVIHLCCEDFKNPRKAGHGGVHLKYQHLGERSRRIVISSRSPWCT